MLSVYSTASYAQLSQLLVFPKKRITYRMEKSNVGVVERNYYNDDCIDYTLVRGDDDIYPLHPGKNTLMRLTASDQFNDPWKSQGQDLRIYPGRFINIEKLKPVVYALPVANGRKVKCKAQDKYVRCNSDSVMLRAVMFRMQPGDTVYAARSGTVCQNVPNDHLYIYHDDGTIAVYSNVKKSVRHTDRIIAGQPIGTLAEGKKSIRLIVLGMERKNLQVSSDLQFPYSCINPVFRTAEGDVCIDGETTLTARTDDDLVMQEMTSKEKKKLITK